MRQKRQDSILLEVEGSTVSATADCHIRCKIMSSLLGGL